MASITISVQSLLNAALYETYTIDDGQTVNQLKTQIQTATSIQAAWYNLVFNEQVLTGTSTLASLNITSGSKLRIANIISRLPTLEARQLAKLNLAALDRTLSGNPRDSFDINELPTKYSGNTIVDNPNTNGLLQGRPWI